MAIRFPHIETVVFSDQEFINRWKGGLWNKIYLNSILKGSFLCVKTFQPIITVVNKDNKSFQFSNVPHALLNMVCFPNTPCEFFNTSRCVVLTHLFTALFYGLRKHTIACKETQKVCYEYTPLCLVVTHLKLMRCKCSWTGEICQSYHNTPLMATHLESFMATHL